ncbi:5'-nucleotidase [Ignatzschineria sp. LJL83]
MALDLSDTLVIGVSSRALFNLEEENRIFQEKGMDAYRAYQLRKENTPLQPGTAFYLVKNLLALNKLTDKAVVEVIVMSRNSPETGIRVLNSLKSLDLEISRMAMSGGEPLSPYIDAFEVDLFLSKDEMDVQTIIDSKACAAALIYAPPTEFNDSQDNRVKIAFDADAVLFSEDSEYIYKTEGIDSFHQNELSNENIPLKEGPFAKLLHKLNKVKASLGTSIEYSPLRIAIVTARNAPSHLRVIKTLRDWGVYVDEAYFLGGIAKDKVLKAFGAHIFFDDQDSHLIDSSKYVPSGKVPYRQNSKMNFINDYHINNASFSKKE